MPHLLFITSFNSRYCYIADKIVSFFSVPRSRSDRRKDAAKGKVAKVNVVLVGDSMFRPHRVERYLPIFEGVVRRKAMGAESVQLVSHPPLSFPGGSCANLIVYRRLLEQVRAVCEKHTGEVVAIPLWIGGNGFYTRQGTMTSEGRVREELGRYLDLIKAILEQNLNACVLVLGLPPRPRCAYQRSALAAANLQLREGVLGLNSNRVAFDDVAPLLINRSHLYDRDGVHLTPGGTEVILTRVSQLVKYQLPLLVERR